MNCAIYARVSTRDKGQDFTNQLLALREFAAKQGWIIVDEYVDQQSAKDDDREQFQRMFQDASQRRFDVLLFWSLDRPGGGARDASVLATTNVLPRGVALIYRTVPRFDWHFPRGRHRHSGSNRQPRARPERM